MKFFTVVFLVLASQLSSAQVLWQDDFSNPANWVINHDGAFNSDWQIGIGLESTGQYGTPAILSTSAGNGYALYNSDSYNNQTADYEQAHITTSNPINLSGNNNVVLEFETQYRRFNDEQTFVIISTDGTFPVLDDPNMDISTLPGVYRVWEIGELAQSVSPGNPTVRSFNISDVAGNQPEVWVRLQFTGIWGYAWYVDDISISVQNDYDGAITFPFVSQFGDGVEYGSIPQSQLPSTFNVGALVTNEGAQSLTNVSITMSCIEDATGIEQFNSSVYIGDLLPGYGFTVNEFPGIPSFNTGYYTVNYSIFSDQDLLEVDYSDNYLSRYFAVTDGYYGLDAIGVVPAGTEFISGGIGTASFTGNADDIILMNYFTVNQTMDVSGIQVMINTAQTLEGSQLMPVLYDTLDIFANDVSAPILLGDIYTVTATDITNGFVYLPFTATTTLTPNAYYAGAALYSNSNTSDIRVLDDLTVEQPAVASMVYLPSDITAYTNGNAYAIQLLSQPPPTGCFNLGLTFDQTPCIDNGDGTGTLYTQGYFTFQYNGDCTVSQLILNDGTQDFVFDAVAPNNITGSQFSLYGFDPNTVYTVYYVLSDGTTSPASELQVNDCSVDAIICDCQGNQHTIGVLGWLGDGGLDDGSYTWAGMPVYLNCDTWGNDCGDDPSGASADPYNVCGGDLPPASDPFGQTGFGCIVDLAGCTQTFACNYDATATVDDGSCTFPGCTDFTACNYDFTAGCDDGSCTFPGCTDFTACNYDFFAGCDNGSCSFPGCTDFYACNYDAFAQCSSGDCIYGGCTDPAAFNYDMFAPCDDGTCVYLTCDPYSLAFDQTPCIDNGDGSGNLYPQGYFTFQYNGDCTVSQLTLNDGTQDYVFDAVAPDNVNGSQLFIYGFDPAVLYTVYYTLSDGTSSPVFNLQVNDCAVDAVICDCQGNQHTIGVLSWLGDGGIDDGTYTWAGVPVYLNCDTWGNDCGDDPLATADPYGVCSGNLPPFNGCSSNEVLGCTDINASNYDPFATINNGSCVYEVLGCTNPYAVNYDAFANTDDASCYYNDFICDCNGYTHTIGVLIWHGDGTADVGTYQWENVPVDFNCATWGFDCGDIVGAPNDDPYGTCLGILPPNNGCVIDLPGCTDPLACNYSSIATIEDGSCTFPGCNSIGACNYDMFAGCNDNSCTYPGCTDPSALNYDASAGCDDGSCEFGVQCSPIYLSFEQVPCVSSNDTLYPSGFFTFYYDGDCSVQSLTIIADTSESTFDLVAPNNQSGSQFELFGFDPSLIYTAYFTLSDGTTSEFYDVQTSDCSGDAYICDCVGNQHSIGVLNWLGDTYADDGTYTWAGLSVNFNCATWGYDCGDVVGAPAEDPFLVCEGNLPPNNGCGSNVILGCTDPTAVNYNITATLNDGSCFYAVNGCTDAFAVNYNPDATINDGSCVYSSVGCTIPTACNYNPEATVNDGTCGPAVGSACNDGNSSTINDVINDNCECIGQNNPNSGCTSNLACNYESTATDDDGSCTYPGCIDITACNYNPQAGCADASCIPSGCTDVAACNYEAAAGCDDGSCIFSGPYLNCSGECFNDMDLDGICDEFEAAGCSDPTACNYVANDPDTSNDICVFPGCTNTQACNYDPNAGCNDSSCAYPGCTNPAACNYDATAGCEDGTCLFNGVAPIIIGPLSVELFGTSIYSVSQIAGASYQWTVTGGNIISGGTSNFVEIQWGTEGNQPISVIINDGNGCVSAATDSVLVLPLSVAEMISMRTIELFPNPANDVVNVLIEGQKPDRIEVMNLMGKQLYSSAFKSQLDVSRLAGGMYILRIWRNGYADTRRLEVQH